MEENQRKYNCDLDKQRSETMYWRSTLENSMKDLESQAVEALKSSADKCKEMEGQLLEECRRSRQLQDQVEILEKHLARLLNDESML